MLLPSRCVICADSGEAICAACLAQLHRPQPFPTPAGLASCAALLDYEGAARTLIVGLKYRNARPAIGRLAQGLAALVPALLAPDGTVDVVSWAPTGGSRRRARGYDQAELLARAVARHLHRPARSLLQRRPGPAQTGRPRADRLAGPSFAATAGAPARVLLIDDVITTGATLSAAAAALHEAGAVRVHGLAAAHTEDHPTRVPHRG